MAVSIGPRIGIDGEKEYRNELKNIIQSTKTLDQQMKALESSFDDETDALEKNQKKTELLTKKKEKLAEEVEKMAEMVEKSTDATGEDSTQTEKWKEQLAKAETELNNVNDALKDQAEQLEELTSPMGELTSKIADQESELEDLRSAYADAYLEFGSTSDECETLASQINTLSSELANNKAMMAEAEGAAADLGTQMDETAGQTSGIGSAADGALSLFAPSMSGMVESIASAGVVEAIGTVAGAAVEIGTAIMESQLQFEEAMGAIAYGAGYTGEGLDSLYNSSVKTWSTFTDANNTLEDTASVYSTLATRLELTEEQATALDSELSAGAESVLKFAQVTNSDATDAINGVMDMMRQWGLTTGDTATDIETMLGIMDQLTVAGSSCDANLGTLTDNLTKQASAFQELGVSQEEALGMMVAFESAGGDSTTLATGMYQAFKNLNGETASIPTAFDQVIGVLKNSDNVTDALNTTISEAGMTLEEVFGSKNAQKIANTFITGKANSDKFTGAINDSKDAVDKLYSKTVTSADKMAPLNNSLEAMANEIIGPGGPVIALSRLTGGLSSVLSMYDTVASRVSQGLTIPTSTTPVTHNAVGYSQARIYDSPTIFGESNGSLLLAGDRNGAEVVVGEGHLLQMMSGALRNALGNTGNTTYAGSTINVYAAEGQNVQQIANLVSKQINRDLRNRSR